MSAIKVQLHGFSDASEQAFAAAINFRAAYSDGTVTTRLVAAKTRVTPMKKQSIPRLELLGALILARLANAIETALASVDILGRLNDYLVLDKEGQTVEAVCG